MHSPRAFAHDSCLSASHYPRDVIGRSSQTNPKYLRPKRTQAARCRDGPYNAVTNSNSAVMRCQHGGRLYVVVSGIQPTSDAPRPRPARSRADRPRTSEANSAAMTAKSTDAAMAAAVNALRNHGVGRRFQKERRGSGFGEAGPAVRGRDASGEVGGGANAVMHHSKRPPRLSNDCAHAIRAPRHTTQTRRA